MIEFVHYRPRFEIQHRPLPNIRRLRSLRLYPLLVLLLARNGLGVESRRLALIDLMIQTYSSRLGVSEDVTFSFVTGNSRLISVEYHPADAGLFQICFDEDFLRTLDDRHLRAAIAHELGHIWIFTHFPYLQTEALANQHALKLVSREDLDAIYEKVRVWKQRQGQSNAATNPAEPAPLPDKR